MPNRLAHENSPYLLQHQHNPVDWYPWGSEALERAKREDKPIFLSIGYAACHWCHVMEHESFIDPRTAALMNEHFINIKVDREERPDLDGIYMQAVVAMTGSGGWPMSVFLTPDGVPFYGGTYFPPARRYNMPAFTEVLAAIANTWENDRARALRSGEQLKTHLQQEMRPLPTAVALSPETAQQAAMGLAQSYDWKNGGWGQAPKFPQPMTIDFLLNRATRGDKFALEIATHALDAMAKGGMYDVVGGGFARYSVDDRWLVPHFEKMLYDNAQLARVYLHAYLITKNAFYRRIVEETLDFVIRELTHPDGGIYSSLDADSEGEEGKFYIWTLEEIRDVLREEADFFIAAYHVTEGGNFEGHTVLQRALSDEELAEQFALPVEKVTPRLQAAHARLLKRRAGRIRPGTDDKVLTAWNGLMLLAFAEAGRYLH
ncbi:MAG: thioredoxin domain-containing protein, partial [Anaerolineales bacterium]|nr:thioredoxin domain-containing protein [Anaerolineales bacterium]